MMGLGCPIKKAPHRTNRNPAPLDFFTNGAIYPPKEPRMPTIRRLSDATVNRIAAGEVLERPASAVKELVENALDAGATRIRVDIAHGGKSLIRVSDNGGGIARDDLPLALERHATSKLDEADIFDIRHLGFRGEALASIASVARVILTSRTAQGEGWAIQAEGGRVAEPRPAATGPGTTVEVRDLFYATPARLKFLHADASETQAIGETLRRLAMAAPSVGFELVEVSDGARTMFKAPAETGDLLEQGRARAAKILGQETLGRCIRVAAEREGLSLSGWIGLPEQARGSSNAQYLFVNGRSVKDKTLTGALRAAYQDLLPSGKHPIAILFLASAPTAVDVNVHPTKAEVRFKDNGLVRGLIVGALRTALAEQGHHSAHGFVPSGALGPAQEGLSPWRPTIGGVRGPSWAALENARVLMAPAEGMQADPDALHQPTGAEVWATVGPYALVAHGGARSAVDLRAARGWRAQQALQHEPHAPHTLPLPEVVTLDGPNAALHAQRAAELTAWGFSAEAFGAGAVLLRAVPACAAAADPRKVFAAALESGEAQRATAIATAIADTTPLPHDIQALCTLATDPVHAGVRFEGTPIVAPLTEDTLRALFVR